MLSPRHELVAWDIHAKKFDALLSCMTNISIREERKVVLLVVGCLHLSPQLSTQGEVQKRILVVWKMQFQYRLFIPMPVEAMERES